MEVEESPLFPLITDDYKEPLKEFEKYLSTRLSKIMLYFGDYTDHGIGHAWRTLDAFCTILANRGLVNEFNQDFALIGICASLLHDIGMGPITSDELRESSASGWVLTDSTRKEQVRDKHHERTAEWILHSDESRNKLDWFPKELLTALANVAMAHRKMDFASNEILRENPRLAFIAALLRLADQMDLSEDRVTHLGLTRRDMPLDDEAQTLEMLKSLADAKFYLDDGGDCLILKSQQPVDNMTLKTLEALNLLVEDIEETLSQIRDITWQGRAILPNQLAYDFHVIGEDTADHALRADFKQVWLYLSEYLYESSRKSSIALREALTNAIDACRLRKAIDPAAECRVGVEHTGDEIIIEDNGVGMSSRVIENHLKVLGSSYYTSPWFLGDPRTPDAEQLSIIGEYGIGVFSYCLLTEEFEIITATEDAAWRRVLFSKIFGVTLGPFRDESLGPGTTLKLKKPKKDEERWPDFEALLQQLHYWFPRSSIPITYTHDENEYSLGNLESRYNHRTEINERMITIEFADEYEGVTSGIHLELGIDFQQRFYSNSDIQPSRSSNTLIEFYKAQDGRTAYTHEYERPIIMYRGLRLQEEDMQLGIFGKALRKLLITPFWFREVPFGWTDSASKEIEDYNPRLRYWCNIDDIHNRPNLQKSQLRNRERASDALNIAAKKIENLSAKHVAALLRNEEISWSLRELLRSSVLEGMSIYGLASYDNLDYILSALLEKMPCYDVISHRIRNFEEILEMPKDTKICIAPFARWIQSMWGVFSYIFLSPIRMLRTRSRIKTQAERVAKKIRSRLKDGSEYRVIFVFCGDLGSERSLKPLKLVMNTLGFENVIAFSRNPYSNPRHDTWLDEIDDFN